MPYTLKKRDCIIALINYRVTKQDHKFGIKILKDIKEALKLDQDNVNTLWQDAYKKEMFQVGVAFKILRDDEHIPVGYKKSSGHIIWSVKMDFTRKAWWVNDGHPHRTLRTTNMMVWFHERELGLHLHMLPFTELK